MIIVFLLRMFSFYQVLYFKHSVYQFLYGPVE